MDQLVSNSFLRIMYDFQKPISLYCFRYVAYETEIKYLVTVWLSKAVWINT